MLPNAREPDASREAYLLTLADALRPIGDPVEIQQIAAAALGEHLAASRVHYLEVEPGAEGVTWVVHRDYHVPGLGSVVGRYRPSEFGASFPAELSAGRSLVVSDVTSSGKLGPDVLERFEALDVRAFVALPLMKDGRHVAALVVHQTQPRSWAPTELETIAETAERTWAAVEQSRAEAALRRSEERFRSVAESGVVAIAFFDTAGAITDANDAFLQMVDYTRAQLQAGEVRWDRLTPPEWLGRTLEAVDAYRRTGRIDPYEKEYFRRNGERFWGLFAGRRIESTGEGVAFVLDITERKRAEAALREGDRRKDEFLAVLAHELRNPLAPIRTGLELIWRAGDSPGAVESVRAMMERQIGHMVRLVDDLLDVSRITSGKIRLQREPTPLESLVNSAIEENRTALTQKRIELSLDLPAVLCVIDVDPTRFVQVISNLLDNAVKFTEPGGSIHVTARVHASTGDGGRELTLSVRDSGIGISAELMPHVFDLFTQGERGASKAGLGIGLALARRLVEMHDGRLEVRSEGLGRGSEFVLRLPVVDTGVSPPRAERVWGRPISKRVVVIDDNRDGADATALLVEQLGGDCRVAYDGISGVREVMRHRPEVVLLDIGMPGLDGYQACSRIREELGHEVTIIALTGFGQDQDRERAMRAGFDAHLTKPADPKELTRLLTEPGGRA